MLKTELDGELSLLQYGRKYGIRGVLAVLRVWRTVCRKLNLKCILSLCFWCNQFYSNETLYN